jgi:alpha-D-ribose 1-methylphosphonate 5-triphosphate synthase subunit PhnI
MGYVAVKGGQEAIDNAARLVEFYRLKEQTPPIEVAQIRSQMRLLVDKVMGEGSLYAPECAALALKQVEGDVFEAAFMMRAYRATLRRTAESEVLNTREMLVRRRISSAFRDIPGGQILGPTRDYTQRLLEPSYLEETLGSISNFLTGFAGTVDASKLEQVTTFPKVIDLLLEEGLMRRDAHGDGDRRVVDVTRDAVRFPAPRSAVLQMLARAETGGLMTLGYSTMRGFAAGGHATVGELRVGEVPVRMRDPRGRVRYLGRVRLTEAEMVTSARGGGQAVKNVPYLSIGYGLCFGQNETKAICMGMLDHSLRESNEANPANSQEFTLYHTEGVEAYGFTNHLKLPHYVTFQSGLDNLRQSMQRAREIRLRQMAGVTGMEEAVTK